MGLLKWFALVIVAAVCVANGASASVVASYTLIAPTSYQTTADTTAWHANVWLCDDAIPVNVVALFNGADLGDELPSGGISIFDNIGKTFWISSDSGDPEFSQALSLLAGNAPAYAWINVSDTCGAFAYSVDWDFVFGLRSHDIKRIGLTVDSASCIYASSPEPRYAISSTMTISFDNSLAAPEPSSFVSLFAGIAALASYRRLRLSPLG